jgi:hypothetical protein
MIKKTEKAELSQAEKNRYDRIVKIQNYLADGYSPVNIKELLHISYNTIRRYASGDPYNLYRFDSGGMKSVNYENYREDIVGYLRHNLPLKEIYAKITADGYNGKLTQVKKYCHKLITELGIEYTSRRNSAGVCVKKNQAFGVHCVTKSNIFQYIWSDKELELSDVLYIIRKYTLVFDIIECVRDFRNIYIEKNADLLKQFTDKYSSSEIKAVKSFTSGILADYDAVKNSVISDLSNGFVEGNNNKVKLIKRSMYGRAGLKLLRAKVILAR